MDAPAMATAMAGVGMVVGEGIRTIGAGVTALGAPLEPGSFGTHGQTPLSTITAQMLSIAITTSISTTNNTATQEEYYAQAETLAESIPEEVDVEKSSGCHLVSLPCRRGWR